MAGATAPLRWERVARWTSAADSAVQSAVLSGGAVQCSGAGAVVLVVLVMVLAL